MLFVFLTLFILAIFFHWSGNNRYKIDLQTSTSVEENSSCYPTSSNFISSISSLFRFRKSIWFSLHLLFIKNNFMISQYWRISRYFFYMCYVCKCVINQCLNVFFASSRQLNNLSRSLLHYFNNSLIFWNIW